MHSLLYISITQGVSMDTLDSKSFTQLPRQSLGCFPTPLHGLQRLSALLGGPKILIKRDDLTGLALGGNKTRKLEYLLADALAQGADTIITGGAAQSNHCRQTAAAAALCGLECHLALGGRQPEQADGNLLLDTLLGATIHWSATYRKGENIPQIAAMLKASGKHPYIIPYGGSNELGAMGFVAAVGELKQQMQDQFTTLSHIIFASSSGGTHAGLLVGRALFHGNFRPVGINIDKDETADTPLAQHIMALADKTAKLCTGPLQLSASDLLLKEEYLGEGYGVVGELEREALTLVARSEGILLDPVYTARAMGALLDMVRNGQLTAKDTVLFWHTGGTPALFPYGGDILP